MALTVGPEDKLTWDNVASTDGCLFKIMDISGGELRVVDVELDNTKRAKKMFRGLPAASYLAYLAAYKGENKIGPWGPTTQIDWTGDANSGIVDAPQTITTAL